MHLATKFFFEICISFFFHNAHFHELCEDPFLCVDFTSLHSKISWWLNCIHSLDAWISCTQCSVFLHSSTLLFSTPLCLTLKMLTDNFLPLSMNKLKITQFWDLENFLLTCRNPTWCEINYDFLSFTWEEVGAVLWNALCSRTQGTSMGFRVLYCLPVSLCHIRSITNQASVFV